MQMCDMGGQGGTTDEAFQKQCFVQEIRPPFGADFELVSRLVRCIKPYRSIKHWRKGEEAL